MHIHQCWRSYKAFLLIENTTKNSAINITFKVTDATRTISSVTASQLCGLASQLLQRGRHVKFLTRKSSLQVRLVIFEAGRNPEPIVAEDSTECNMHSPHFQFKNDAFLKSSTLQFSYPTKICLSMLIVGWLNPCRTKWNGTLRYFKLLSLEDFNLSFGICM